MGGDAAGLRAVLCRLGACALALLAAATVGAADLEPLLGRISAAYGRSDPPASILQTGHTVSHTRGEGALRRAYQSPDQFRIDIHYSTGTETRILNGLRSWQHGKPMTDAFRGALQLQAARLALPWNLLAARASLRDAGEQKLTDGKVLHFVELPLGESLRLVAEIDPDSGRIMRSRGIISATGHGEMEFGTVYDDFRTTDGRLYAAVEHHFAMGRYIGRSLIEKVEFDVPLDDKLFRPEIPGMF